jgi:hypothetical protein
LRASSSDFFSERILAPRAITVSWGRSKKLRRSWWLKNMFEKYNLKRKRVTCFLPADGQSGDPISSAWKEAMQSRICRALRRMEWHHSFSRS